MVFQMLADFAFLVALVVCLGCSTHVEGYVRQREVYPIIPSAVTVTTLLSILIVIVTLKLFFQFSEYMLCTRPSFWLC